MLPENMESTFEIRFSDGGKKLLKKLSRLDVEVVLKKIAELKKFSEKTTNIKRLRGTKEVMFRMRIGDLRVIFEVERTKKLIWILFVGYRGGVYRNLR